MIVVANWKAYVADLKAARALTRAAERLTDKHRQVVVAPPAPLLAYLRDHTHKRVAFSLQDVSDATGGAATGETTGTIAQAAGATYTILGHSERRARGEDDAAIARKAQAALSAGLRPILCIGERERDAEADYLNAVREQLGAVLSVLTPEQRAQLIIAYEPVWAIGQASQDAIAPADLTEMVRYIRKAMEGYLSPEDAQQVPVLYGGSVDPTNVAALAAGTGIQGFLVGRASTDPKTFTALVRAIR